MIYAGWLYNGIIWGFVIEDCGESWEHLGVENINNSMREAVDRALEAIHKLNSLHNDVAFRNIAGTGASSVRLFDFGRASSLASKRGAMSCQWMVARLASAGNFFFRFRHH
jgi:tRNA A-37 threonylcarbamoyl transferase component Bud32